MNDKLESDKRSVETGPIFYSALVMGLIMIGTGTFFEVMHLGNFTLKIFMFCTGLGIILGAFGSKASVTLPGQSMTIIGCAALAVVIFFIILDRMDGRYLRIKIEGDTREATMVFEGDNDFFGSRLKTSYDFVVFDKDIVRKKLALIVNIGDREQIFSCIDAALLRPYLGSGDTLQWRYNSQDASLNDETNKLIAKVGPCPSGTSTGVVVEVIPAIDGSSWSLLQTAYAEEETPTVDELINNLNSDSTYVRRDARSELGKKGMPAARPLLTKVQSTDSSYRTKLGALVSLNEIAQSNAGQSGALKAVVEEDDLKALTKASASDDGTVRSYATNVLVNLKDPRAIPLVIQQFPESSEDGQRNLLVVLSQTVPLADEKQKQSAAEIATSVEPKDEATSVLIKSIQAAAE
ncbi:hypothetical protein [Pseudomonas sp. P108]|uniref:HEAT repeat domain-containing protein n=1 Tax=Pseudomonas sp. P108 TaxID=1837993 RepID=UPI00293441B4|nr:hypothetical protein [Pseudomonas sp. P108]WNZ86987.1 hypothetical protein QOM10_13855 [Pseudomonas sp. P108]